MLKVVVGLSLAVLFAMPALGQTASATARRTNWTIDYAEIGHSQRQYVVNPPVDGVSQSGGNVTMVTYLGDSATVTAAANSSVKESFWFGQVKETLSSFETDTATWTGQASLVAFGDVSIASNLAISEAKHASVTAHGHTTNIQLAYGDTKQATQFISIPAGGSVTIPSNLSVLAKVN
jgi:hypothetical protein